MTDLVPTHGIARVFSDDTAKAMLEDWLRNKARILRYVSVQKWEYTTEPFWAIVAELWGFNLTGIYGFHIHTDGEILLVGKQPKGRNRYDSDSGC